MNNVEIKDVSFKYPGTDRLILDGINMNIHEGDFVCLLGQSGCGKSTLLRLLAGLEKSTKGELLVDGTPIKGASLDRSVVFQDYGLFPWMSAGDNITLAIRKKYPRMSKKEAFELAGTMVEKVGLDRSVLKKLPKELSGGMKQRCAIARSFSVDSPILLMDEPFGALDAVTRSRLQDMTLDLWSKDEKKKTVFFVTHDVEEALLLANRIFVLGQSPSHVIFDWESETGVKPTRDTLYTNTDVMALRNELIKQINLDVASHA